MGYLDYLQHGKKLFMKEGQLPVYLVYFITDACNAKCKHCLLADGAHPGPRFLVGIPGDVDLAMFTFGPSGPVRHRRPFTETLAAASPTPPWPRWTASSSCWTSRRIPGHDRFRAGINFRKQA